VKKTTLKENIYFDATCIYNKQEQQANALTYSNLGCYKPRITADLSPQVAVLGSTVKLLCHAVGAPTPTIYWLKDSSPINTDFNHKIQKDGTLVIHSFAEDSAGYYQCVAENAVGKDETGTKVDLVSDEVIPRFLETPADVDAIVNSIALLNCQATGFPRPYIYWMKNGN